MGFSVPIGDWLRGELKDWGAALLDRKRLESEGFLDAESVHELWEEHQAGHARSQWELWNCLMFETWLERWGTSDPQSAADAEVPLLITVDEAGRDLDATGEVVSTMLMPIPGVHALVWTSLMSWTINGVAAWGEDQEPWPTAEWAKFKRGEMK